MTEILIERHARPPMEGVERESPFVLVRDASADGEAGDGLTLDGYAAVFNRETIIDSWEGRFKEKIAPGAMKKSFRENPPVVQFDHGRHPMVGSIPIAAVETCREETDPVRAPEGGAHIIARLHDNWLIQPVRDAISTGAIGGMSFRFGVVKEEWRDHTGKLITDEDELYGLLRRTWVEDVPDEELLVRTLKELKVPELGPVVWPAYGDTSVGVRSKDVLTAQPEADNSDGRKFTGKDGAELAVWGSNVVDPGFEDAAIAAIGFAGNDGWTIAYQAVTPGWASFSGTQGKRVLYQRMIALCDGQYAAFRLEYSAVDMSRLDPVVNRLVKSLKGVC